MFQVVIEISRVEKNVRYEKQVVAQRKMTVLFILETPVNNEGIRYSIADVNLNSCRKTFISNTLCNAKI